MSIKDLLTPLQDNILQHLNAIETNASTFLEEKNWVENIMASYKTTTELDSRIYAVQLDLASGMQEALVIDARTELQAFVTALANHALHLVNGSLPVITQGDCVIELWEIARSFGVVVVRMLASTFLTMEESVEIISSVQESFFRPLLASAGFIEFLENIAFPLLQRLRSNPTSGALAQFKTYKEIFCKIQDYDRFSAAVLNATQTHYTTFAERSFQTTSEHIVAINGLIRSELEILSDSLDQFNLFEIEMVLQKIVVSGFMSSLQASALIHLIHVNDLTTLKSLALLVRFPNARIFAKFKAVWQQTVEKRIEWHIQNAQSFMIGVLSGMNEMNKLTEVVFENMSPFSGFSYQTLQRQISSCKNNAAICLARYFHQELSAHHKFRFNSVTFPEEIKIAIVMSGMVSANVFKELYIRYMVHRVAIGTPCFNVELERACAEALRDTMGNGFFATLEELIQSPLPSTTGAGSLNTSVVIYRYKDVLIDRDEPVYEPSALTLSHTSYEEYYNEKEPRKKLYWCNALSVASAIFQSSRGAVQIALTFYQRLLIEEVCKRQKLTLSEFKTEFSDIPEPLLEETWHALTSGDANILKADPITQDAYVLNMNFTTDSPVAVFVAPDLIWSDVAGTVAEEERFTQGDVIDSLIVNIIKENGEYSWVDLVSAVRERCPNPVDEKLIKGRFEIMMNRGFVERKVDCPDQILYRV